MSTYIAKTDAIVGTTYVDRITGDRMTVTGQTFDYNNKTMVAWILFQYADGHPVGYQHYMLPLDEFRSRFLQTHPLPPSL